MNIIKSNSKIILEDKIYPTLYKFIINDKIDEDIMLISKNEFN
jgi:hypothetical protein